MASENGENGSGTAVEKYRAEGRMRANRVRETREIEKVVRGLEFGGVKGAHMSAETRWQVAKMCLISSANPATHVDILGGRPYLNADYWSDAIHTNPYFIDHDQQEISEESEAEMRAAAEKKEERAEKYFEKAESAGSETYRERAEQILQEAMDLHDQADEMPMLRRQWGVPDWATHVVLTTIRRFINSAPLQQIRSGEVDRHPWVKQVRECNWAGGKGEEKAAHHKDDKAFSWDPIGDANPAKTARSRSLRRCARRSFPEWKDKFEALRDRAERAITADLEEIGDIDPVEMVTPEGRPAITTGSGEPEMGGGSEATPLPEATEVEGSEEEDEEEPSEAELIDRERKAYFANLRDGPGIEGDEARYAWQEEQGLPRSTRDWELAHWRQANRTLTADARKEYEAACEALGIDADVFATDHLDRPAKLISDLESLTEKLEGTPVGAEAGEGDSEPALDL